LTANLASGTTVNLLGEVTFGFKEWDGPLFEIGTSSDSGTFTFNGNGESLNGQGASYWDGEGTNGGVTKPVSGVDLVFIQTDRTERLSMISILWSKSSRVEEPSRMWYVAVHARCYLVGYLSTLRQTVLNVSCGFSCA
jgi:hypothetical protein